ncbi:hypothetical protein [Parathalassolituus penaei]|uniref:Lipoprotein n=1 Tax=Parathalassolituus penaei TaxID=2997323 RepID=A0A9X3EGU2_9GAMM|nr:hypothetical protein [Parathalassolituus penaei]MCY0967323.1 hypothetical protein [Parathalassolituus penaei]
MIKLHFLPFLAGMVLALSGCGETITTNIEISQNGEPYLIPVQEFDGTVTWPEITEYEVTATREYLDGKIYWDQRSPERQAAVTKLKDWVEYNDGVISGEQYPYIVVIPITSSHEIHLQKTGGLDDWIRLPLKRCVENYYIGDTRVDIRKDKKPEVIDGVYHYNLYAPYNEMALRLLLAYISDICISYYSSSGGTGESLSDTYVMKSNTLVIPADEIKQALDYWNIPHELPQE